MKFRKRPVIVDAVRVGDAITNARFNWRGLPQWLRDAHEDKTPGKGILFLPDRVEILTLEGKMTAERDDWIIRGIKGEIYPCKPEIFAETYEPVDDGVFVGAY